MKINGKVRLELKDGKTGKTIKDTGWINNVVPTVGRSALAAILAGKSIITNPGKITYGAVGTGSATPAITGTKLDTELARTTISTSTNIDNQVIIETFFSTTQANGTLTEFGLFGENATTTADSGTMFQWITISPSIVKDNTLTLLITSTIPIDYV